MNELQGVNFKNSSREICPFVISEPRSGRPQVLNDRALKAAIEEDSSLMWVEPARQFKVSDEIVRLHLHRLIRRINWASGFRTRYYFED